MEKKTPAQEASERYQERELDLKVALLMGYEWVTTDTKDQSMYGYRYIMNGDYYRKCTLEELETLPLFPSWDDDLPPYSTSDSLAVEVLKAGLERFGNYEQASNINGSTLTCFGNNIFKAGKTFSESVCLAFVEACTREVKEKDGGGFWDMMKQHEEGLDRILGIEVKDSGEKDSAY